MTNGRKLLKLPALLASIFLILSASIIPIITAVSPEIHPIGEDQDENITSLTQLKKIEVLPVDEYSVREEDEEREQQGLPYRFALPNAVSISPESDGTWEETADGSKVWRARISSPNAKSLNFGFETYVMPKGGSLYLYAPNMRRWIRPFTSKDNKPHRQLWTPVLLADEVIIEVNLPAHIPKESLNLLLNWINVGYRGFGVEETNTVDPLHRDVSGACNVDVVCPEGEEWCKEIRAVALYTILGSFVCTGFMVNNVAKDRTPYFMTANHCGITGGNPGNDASVVVYWNYETSSCGLVPPDGQLDDFQTGASLLASFAASDFALLKLDDDADPAWCVSFAGWDRSGVDVTSAVAIHHPSCDEKRISFENDRIQTTSFLDTNSPGDGTHFCIDDWDKGTTEHGSSGSPLFDPSHRVIGQLHGGNAACGNDSSDWYGKFSVSWDGGGTPLTRLRDWMDPGNTGTMTVKTLVSKKSKSSKKCPKCSKSSKKSK